MAKKKKEIEEEVKASKKKGKKQEAPAKKEKKAKSKPAPEKKPKASGDDGWDEQTGGGGDFFKLPVGETEVLIRIRSVISMGQCFHTFNNKRSDKAVSTLGLVLECWPYKIKKGKIKLDSKEPAIVYESMKAIRGNKDSHYTGILKDVSENGKPDGLHGAAGMGVVYTSDKGYMYLRKRVMKAGLAEQQAVPKAQHEGFLIPNLNAMTKDAMQELNPIIQVADMLEKAVNFPGSEAEEVLAKIRKKNPDYAVMKKQDGSKGSSGKKGKKKKKKLDDSKEY